MNCIEKVEMKYNKLSKIIIYWQGVLQDKKPDKLQA